MSHIPEASHVHDVLIVGGGFAGSAAAVALGRAGRSVMVIDGNLPRNRFASHAHGYLTREGMSPLDMRDIGQAEAKDYGVTFVTGEVTDARVSANGREVALTLADGSRHRGRRLLVATGLTDVLPGIPGVSERWGRDAIHCPYCHGYEVRGQRLGLIVRPTPMTVHHALHLRQWSDRFTLFLNGADMPGAEDLEKLAARDIRVVPEPVAALEIDREADTLRGVRLDGGEVVPIDAVFVMPLFTANTSLLAQMGAEIEETVMGSNVKVDWMGATSVPGVWAAGNVAQPMAQLAAAAASGSMAAGAINMSLVEEDVERAVATRRLSLVS